MNVKTDRREQKWKKGFTLVELVVVVVVLLIIAGAAVFGVAQWMKWTKFKQQNEYARSLYVAAQNQLTEFSENGQLEKIGETLDTLDLQIQSGTKRIDGYQNPLDVKAVGIVDSTGKDYKTTSLDELWPESAGKGAAYRGAICSIIGTPADYKEYQNGTCDTAHQILYDIITPYLYDISILNKAVICLEFTPSDGQVYSVLYSDYKKVDGFTYGEDEGAIGSIKNRTKSARYDRMIGYYGVDTLYKATSLNATKPTISNVMLNNEETLNLSFKVGKAPLNELTYEIKVFDKEKNTEYDQLHFQLDATYFTEQQKGMAFARQVACEVYKFVEVEGGEPRYVSRPFNMVVYLDEKSDNTIHIILDGADQDATSAQFYDAFADLTGNDPDAITTGSAAEKFSKTMSFHRFGIDAENIYCKVRATGTFYKTSAMKSSNTENAYFASGKVSKDSGTEEMAHGIANARHLYNMRYLEDVEIAKNSKDISAFLEKEKVPESYQVLNDFDWTEFVKDGWYFASGAGTVQSKRMGRSAGMIETVETTEGYFPSIKTLRDTSTMKSAGTKTNTIIGLRIDAGKNPKEIYEKNAGEKDLSAGLFLLNKGCLQNLALDDVQVTGGKNVGGFCGASEGTLASLETKNTSGSRQIGDARVPKYSEIQGRENVGGIAGQILVSGAKDVELKGLVNRAVVTGSRKDAAGKEWNQNIGGITGFVSTNGNQKKVDFVQCKNYGQVEARNLLDENIGGIVGRSEGHKGNIVLEKCISSPQYAVFQNGTDLVTTDVAGNLVKVKDKLLGKYVGGIAGYSTGTTFAECSTKKDKVDGYVFGDQYVGGIVGYNDNSGENATRKISGKTSGYGVNEANVLGNQYVGGVTGYNSDRGIIANWKNTGFVGATTAYAGGIVGSNGENKETPSAKGQQSVIANCNVEITVSNNIKMLRGNALFKKGDYVGGIAGYNDGLITNYSVNEDGKKVSEGAHISSVSDVTGKNFVGGIVGYNDWDAEVEGYSVIGGNIVGTGSFVGGYAGFNSSKYLLEELQGGGRKYIESNPNRVEGTYCVGGTIGGNILRIGDNETVETTFAANNFLGEMNATAMVGGFIGYNQSVNTSVTKQQLKAAVDKSAAVFEENQQNYLLCLANVPSLATSAGNFIITGNGDASTQAWLGGINAKIYVAGVIGYNNDETHLTIRNVVNRSPITATEAVQGTTAPYTERTYDGREKMYSYAGGIIGKVSKNTIIDNCKNQGSGRVTADKATYTGGICEINEGTILNCLAVSQSGKDYVGGIAGINYAGEGKPGVIEGCSLRGNLTGKNYVGGIVSENYGTIQNCAIEGAGVTATGTVGYVGMIAATNKGQGNIVLAGSYNSISVQSAGDYVGGLVGENSGNLSLGNGFDKCLISGSVSGRAVVGGFVGQHNGTAKIQNISSTAVVTAEIGTVGGIAGESAANIENCTNSGVITASKSGNAGGIVADNKGTISDCVDYGAVIATSGKLGGITALNSGMIQRCQTVGKGGKITFESPYNVGGICAENSGNIESSKVQNILVRNIEKSGASDVNLGGIAGLNTGSITIEETVVAETEITSATDAVNMGGIVGNNTAKLQGDYTFAADSKKTTEYLQLTFIGNYANVGGAIGKNAGEIGGMNVCADITGTYGADAYGYGGIAGVNSGSITSCGYSGRLKVDGQASAIANVGGMTGRNEGTISECAVGTNAGTQTFITSGATNTTSGFAYLGGMVGWNFGTISSCDNAGNSVAAVQVTGYKGHTGGMIGFQAEGASVAGTEKVRTSTGKGWNVLSKEFSNDCGTGGVIGYNESGNDIQFVDNYANVSSESNKNTTIGGLIGRSQNKYVLTAKVTNCANYGGITGRMAGGLIGRMKYKTFSFDHCYNYGKITSKGESAGGILGDTYMAESDGYMTFTGCRNFGEIIGVNNRVGGIVGNFDPAGKSAESLKVVFSDCVNEGVITANSGGGILGQGAAGQGYRYLYRCRNYGNSASTGFYGLAAGKNTEVVDCYSIGNTQNLTTANSSVFMRNYYLSTVDLDLGEGTGVYLKTDVPNSNATLKNFKNLGTTKTDLNLGSATNKYVTFELVSSKGTAAKLGNFGIVFAGNSANTSLEYQFTVSAMTDEGELYLMRSGDETVWGSAANATVYTAYGIENNRSGSYWSASFAKKNVSAVTLHFVGISEGTITTKDEKTYFTATKNGLTNLKFYQVMGAEDGEGKLSTVDGYYAFLDGLNDQLISYDPIVNTKAEISFYASGTSVSKREGDNFLMKEYPGLGASGILNKEKWLRQVFQMANASAGMTLQFTMPDGVKLSGFQILMANNKNVSNEASAEVRRYEYTTTIRYKDGTESVMNGSKVGTYRDVEYTDENIIQIDCEADKEIQEILLKVNKVYRDGAPSATNTYVCFWGAWGYRDYMPDIQSNQMPDIYVSSEGGKPQAAALSIYQPIAQTVNANTSGLPANELRDAADASLWNIKSQEGNLLLKNIAERPIDGWSDNSPYLAGTAQSRYLEEVPEASKLARQRIYESIEIGNGDGKAPVEEYYDSLAGTTDPNPISITSMSVAANTITCDWKLNLADPAYKTSELVYVIRNQETGEVVATNESAPESFTYGINQYKFAVDPGWVGYDIEIYVRACGPSYAASEYNEDYYPTNPEVAKQPGASEWTQKKSTVMETLATPKVHIELVDSTNFMVVLDNPEDYIGKNVKISGKVDGTAYTIVKTADMAVDSGNMSKLFTFASKNDNINLTGYAESTDSKYAKSSTLVLQTAFYGTNDLKTYKYYAATFNDFYGDQVENMYNSIQIGSAIEAKTEVYLNTELEIEDYKVGEDYKLPVVVSQGETHFTFASGNLTVNLGNLPSDMLSYENVKVRTYPWSSQSYATYYGHMVQQGISEDDLIGYLKGEATLTDPGRGENALRTNPPAVFVDGKLQDGYILRKNIDGTYDILYSSIMNFRSVGDTDCYECQIYEKDYKITASQTDRQGTVESADSYKKPIYKLPKIDPECEYTDDSYTFTWNSDEAVGTENYALKLYGLAVDGSRVLLDTAETAGHQYTFKNAEKNWNYSEMILEVSQVGTVEKNGKTAIFPSTAEQNFEIKLKFSQITKPVTTLHKEEDGTVQKNTLLYDVNYLAIPEAERNSGELASYEIRVNWQSHDENVVKPMEEKLAFIKAFANTRSLLEGKADVSVEGKIDGTATLTWMEGEAQKTQDVSLAEDLSVLKECLGKENVQCTKIELGTNTEAIYQWSEAGVSKTMTLLVKASGEAYCMQKQLDETLVVPAEAALESCSTMLDLSDYERGDTVTIAVRALATDDAKKYRDGLEGIEEELNLPSRLDVPDVSIFDMEQKYAADQFQTLEVFADGFDLTYKPDAQMVSATVAGRYQIAMAVYDAPQDASYEKMESGGWCDGAVEVLAGKDEFDAVTPTITMDGNFFDSSYVLQNLSPEYAGKWLKIAMRSISDSNISSYWSDEDDRTESTLNYKWIQIPRVRIADPEIVTDSRELTYEVKEEPVRLTQTEVSFRTTDYADVYHITKIREALAGVNGLGDDTFTAKYVDEFYLKKAEDGTYDIYFASGDPKVDVNEMIRQNQLSADGNVVQKQDAAYEIADSGLVYLGQLNETGTQIPCREVFYDSTTEADILMQSVIYLEKDDESEPGTVKITLPDVEKIEDVEVDRQNLFTNQVSVQNRNISEPERFADSAVCNWYRSVNADKESVVGTVIVEPDELVKDLSFAGAVPGELVQSEIGDFYCQSSMMNMRNWLVYRVKVVDQSGNIYFQGNVSAYASGIAGSTITNCLLLPKEFEQFAGEKYQLQICAVAAIVDGGSGNVAGGMTKWQEFDTPICLSIPVDEPATENEANTIWMPAEEDAGSTEQNLQTDETADPSEEDAPGNSGETTEESQDAEGTGSGSGSITDPAEAESGE